MPKAFHSHEAGTHHYLCIQIEAEQQEEITDSFEIESVPSFIVLRVRVLCTRVLLPFLGLLFFRPRYLYLAWV
jgi:hypothetical protein